ncbi:TetR family transcriptional regulator [Nocardioides zeae]|uniref:TetR family transcriptional regulator n=1 Tax=Nocardioides imazamoxiresistens TaxID=3231893 RepID=A0ABU3Q212_9ACTN|nr:TetR family transcriptional regulator [Nocardioides zeae]MDT9595077.1 TetR family transcriptional regulator [Nocardioides zeae]
MPTPDDPPTLTRVERKEQTRQAILAAALALSSEGGLSALSLRQVARHVGVVPTAFYRHFDSIEDLGLALVDDAFVSLRAMLRDVRTADPTFADVIDSSVRVLTEHVRAQREHFAFIARERFAGPAEVRTAIRHEIELCERELAADLARFPGTESWSREDLQVLANLIVGAVVSTAEDLLVAEGRRAGEDAVAARSRTQLRMMLIGALNWRSS